MGWSGTKWSAWGTTISCTLLQPCMFPATNSHDHFTFWNLVIVFFIDTTHLGSDLGNGVWLELRIEVQTPPLICSHLHRLLQNVYRYTLILEVAEHSSEQLPTNVLSDRSEHLVRTDLWGLPCKPQDHCYTSQPRCYKRERPILFQTYATSLIYYFVSLPSWNS